MSKKELFKQMLEQAKAQSFYAGTGNPESKILLIGKEVAIDDHEGKGKVQHEREFINNISNWEKDIYKNPNEIQNWNGLNYTPLYPYKGQILKIDNKKEGINNNRGTNRTWYNYQKLCNLIFKKENNQIIDFHEHFFITELNATPSLKTATADKKTVSSRLEFIKSSTFFQSFPVVIIAGLGYLEISEYKNEVEELFGVKFLEKRSAGGVITQPYWVHYSEDRKKILINTRQLSMTVSDKLLSEISSVIHESGLV